METEKGEAPAAKLGKALATEEVKIRPGMSLHALLKTTTIKSKFSDVLEKKAPAFMSSVVSAVSANKHLQNCEPMSIISSAMVAATLDLPINPQLGMAHMVPYKGVATFQIGWKGIYQLAMRSGQYLTINIAQVNEGELVKHDKFKGTMEFDAEQKRSDKVIGTVLYFKLLNGFEKWFYMTTVQLEAHAKRYSQNYKKYGTGVWKDNFPAMCEKTVAKLGLSKFGPLTVEMQIAFKSDQAAILPDGEPDYIDGALAEEEETSATDTGKEKKKNDTNNSQSQEMALAKEDQYLVKAVIAGKRGDTKVWMIVTMIGAQFETDKPEVEAVATAAIKSGNLVRIVGDDSKQSQVTEIEPLGKPKKTRKK